MSEGGVLFGRDSEAASSGSWLDDALQPFLPAAPPARPTISGLSASIRESLQTVMNTLYTPRALLAPDGSILVSNDAWNQIAEGYRCEQLKLGGNYFEFYREQAADGWSDGLAILSAIAELTTGQANHLIVDMQGDAAFNARPFKTSLNSVAFGSEYYILVHRYEGTRRGGTGVQPESAEWRVLRAQEEERRRVARDLHDSTSQLLVGLQLSVAQLKSAPHSPGFESILVDCETALASIQREIRTLSYIWHPPQLGSRDLASALEIMASGFAERAGLQAYIAVEDVGEIGPMIEGTFYRVAQEALANIYRHAKASRIGLRLTATRKYVHLVIGDDGVGLGAAHPLGSTGVGMASMMERVAKMAGRLSVRHPGCGTSLIATLPRA